MTDEHISSRLAALVKTLKPKTKQPVSTKVLNTWIAQAEARLGDEATAGRLGWLIASSVAIAAVQRALDADGRQFSCSKAEHCSNTDSMRQPAPLRTSMALSVATWMPSLLRLKTFSTSRGDH